MLCYTEKNNLFPFLPHFDVRRHVERIETPAEGTVRFVSSLIPLRFMQDDLSSITFTNYIICLQILLEGFQIVFENILQNKTGY